MYNNSFAKRRGIDSVFDEALSTLYAKYGDIILPIFSKKYFSSRIANDDFRKNFNSVVTQLLNRAVPIKDCIRIFNCLYYPKIADFLQEILLKMKSDLDASYVADLFSGGYDTVKLIDNDLAKAHFRANFYNHPARESLKQFGKAGDDVVSGAATGPMDVDGDHSDQCESE